MEEEITGNQNCDVGEGLVIKDIQCNVKVLVVWPIKCFHATKEYDIDCLVWCFGV